MKGNIFIKRPVMAISISILILAIGLISLFTLPVEQYPDIAPPTVHVSATYTGADANAVMNSVIMPLEESINGVENMMYMTSTATNAGSATIEVYFKQGTNPDMAAVNVQNRVTKAQGLSVSALKNDRPASCRSTHLSALTDDLTRPFSETTSTSTSSHVSNVSKA